MMKSQYFFLLAAWFLAFSEPAASAKPCSEEVQTLLAQSSSPREIKDFDDLLWAFTRGFVPNLEDSSQRHAFEIYRKTWFGDPNTNLNENSLDELASLLSKHPELKKEPFRNFRVKLWEKSYPVTKELSAFLNSQSRSAGQIRGNLFHMDANRGFWKKVLGYREPESLRGNSKERREHFARFLDERFPRELRSQLADKQIYLKVKSKKLYAGLKEERVYLLEKGKDVAPISRAMVDVIHTVGFGDAETIKALKSSDGLERLNAFKTILQARDSFAVELGFDGQFKQVLKELGVSSPSSLSGMDVWKRLQSLENQVVKNGNVLGTRLTTVRHLSLVESPFRSCLGGDDCSSMKYFSRALDPNYHYFTLTDEKGHSSGHVTVVLGEVQVETGEEVRVAFVDKLQNVASEDIALLLEGVRRSVEEQGYKLAIPEEVSGYNEFSNTVDIRNWVKNNLLVNAQESLSNFRPHAHAYKFPLGFSRAQDKLASKRVSPMTSPNWEMLAGELDTAWKVEGLNLEGLVQSSINLKYGSVEDKIRYISSMDAIRRAGLSFDPDFERTLKSWLQDHSQSFKLRRRIFLYRWFDRKNPTFPQMLETFKAEERVVLIQNLWDTPRYKEDFLMGNGIMFALPLVRHNPKLRKSLARAYSPQNWEKIVKVLQAEDISDREVLGILGKIRERFDFRSIEKLAGILRVFRGSSLESWMEGELARNFVEGIPSDAALGRNLVLALDSLDELVSGFARKIISRESTPLTGVDSKLLASGLNLRDTDRIWIQKRDVEIGLKAQFLMAQIGTGHFERYLKLLPGFQRKAIWREIDRETSFRLFRDLARKLRMSKNLFDRGALESFEFRRRGFPDGSVEGEKVFGMGDAGEREVRLTRAFEMQATPVTQLQYYLVMGENPSHFMIDGQRARFFGGEFIDPNRPVEMVSWHHAQAFIEKLNQLQDDYVYGLPTEAEWEFAARGGTDTKYWFGDSESDLEFYGWFDKNSNGKIHRIGYFPANPLGLYDMIGNTWEWTGDWYGRLSTQGVADPSGADSGSERVIRGGSWHSNAWDLRSAFRYGVYPDGRSDDLGFRLIRRPKSKL